MWDFFCGANASNREKYRPGFWFDTHYDEDLILQNPPGQGGHWGHLAFDWSTARAVRAGGEIRVRLELDDGELDVVPI